jgi:glycosyltransferase involved in cell wall biosynthesis
MQPTPTNSEACLSVVMPVYNEAATVEKVVRTVLDQPSVVEILVVDDCSSDSTWEILQKHFSKNPQVKLLKHSINRGKGAAVRTGIQAAVAPFVIVQDADLEYTPTEFPALLRPLLDGSADAVFGSRFIGSQEHRVLYFWHSVGNNFLTLLSNMFTNINLTDMETCYKAVKRELLQSIPLCEERFGFEPEITAKLARRQARIYEVAVSYHGRTYAEGKKINWKDGFRAIWCIVRYGIAD